MNICCPLCGKHTPIEAFDPSDFEDDIYGVEVTGLGRGRGFAVTARFSVLDDPRITGLIADRCRRVLQVINEDGRHHDGAEYEMVRLLNRINREADYEFESLAEAVEFLLEF